MRRLAIRRVLVGNATVTAAIMARESRLLAGILRVVRPVRLARTRRMAVDDLLSGGVRGSGGATLNLAHHVHRRQAEAVMASREPRALLRGRP